MTDDVERELRDMFDARVADLPDTYDAPPELLRRAQGRRTAKFASIGAAALVVIIGSAGAIAQSVDGSDPSKVNIATPVPTVASSTSTTFAHSIAVAPKALPPIPIRMMPDASVATTHGIVIADYLGHIEFYDATANAWQTMPGAPDDLAPLLVASRGNKVFVVSGLPYRKRPATVFAVLDVGTRRWTTLAKLPDDLYYAFSCSGSNGCASSPATGDANRLFVYSGVNVHGNAVGTSREMAFEYDIAANRWTKLPRSPLSFRKGSAVQWTGRELLVWGGADYEKGGARALGDGAAYDPVTRTWRTLPPAPMHASAGAASVWTGSQMLVWGGSKHPGGGSDSEVGDGAAYNPATNTWARITPSPLPATTDPAAVWTGHEMLVFTSTYQQTNDVAAYDPASDRWRSLPPAPESVRAAFGFLARLQFASWINGEAFFGLVSQGGQFAAFRYSME